MENRLIALGDFERVEGLSKKGEKMKEHMDTDNCVVIARERGWVEMAEGMEG